MFKEKLMLILLKIFKKIEERVPAWLRFFFPLRPRPSNTNTSVNVGGKSIWFYIAPLWGGG